ncbi:DNA repair protein rad2, partial [Rhizophlyctis rosea]
MGVKGLWSLVEPVAQPVRLETLTNKRLAVDASIWLHQFLKAMRDKEGNPLRGAHIVGFFRRICKLIFYGVKPVFVFDGGTPTMKRLAITQRRRRKGTVKASLQRTAEKILQAQMQMHALREVEGANGKSASPSGTPARPSPAKQSARRADAITEMPADALFMDDLTHATRSGKTLNGASASPSPEKDSPLVSEAKGKVKPKRKRDEFELPEGVDESTVDATLHDPRLVSEEELRTFIDSHKSSLDFTKVDIDSTTFHSLPIEVQHEIILDQKNKSRQSSYKRLEQMVRAAPTAADFSKLQIRNLVQRNYLTERYWDFNRAAGVEKNPEAGKRKKAMRVASERNREYVLVKNDEVGGVGGWTMKTETVSKKVVDRVGGGGQGFAIKPAPQVIDLEMEEVKKERERRLWSSDDEDEDSWEGGSVKGGDSETEVKEEEVLERERAPSPQAFGEDDEEDEFEDVPHIDSGDQFNGDMRSDTVAPGSPRFLDDIDFDTGWEDQGSTTVPMYLDQSAYVADDESIAAVMARFQEIEDVVPPSIPDTPPTYGRRVSVKEDEGAYVRDEESVAAVEARFEELEKSTADGGEVIDVDEVGVGLTQADWVDDEESVEAVMARFESLDQPKPIEKRVRKISIKIPQGGSSSGSPSVPPTSFHQPTAPRTKQELFGYWKAKAPEAFRREYAEEWEAMIWKAVFEWEFEDFAEEGAHAERRMEKSEVGSERGVAAGFWVECLRGVAGWNAERAEVAGIVGEGEGASGSGASSVVEEVVAEGVVEVSERSGVAGESVSPTRVAKGAERSVKVSPAPKLTLFVDDSDEEEDAAGTEDAMGSPDLGFQEERDGWGDPVDQSSVPLSRWHPWDQNENLAPSGRGKVIECAVGVGNKEGDRTVQDTAGLGATSVENVAKSPKSVEPMGPEVAASQSRKAVTVQLFDDEDEIMEDVGPSGASSSVATPVEQTAVDMVMSNRDEAVALDDAEGGTPTPPALAESSYTVSENIDESESQITDDIQFRPSVYDIPEDMPTNEELDLELDHMGEEEDEEEPESNLDVPTVLDNETNEYARFVSTLSSHRTLASATDRLEQEMIQLNAQKRKEMRDASDITTSMVTETQELLRLFGLPYLVAPMEAESQCAFLLEHDLVDGIVTDDSDVFLFGGKVVYRNMFNQQRYVERYEMKDLERDMRLGRERLVALAYLLGSDYTEGVQGVGPVGAMEILDEFGGGVEGVDL